MRVRYSPRAFADREQIFEYLFQLSPGGARNAMASIREATALLAEHPHSRYATQDPQVRVKFIVR